MIDKRIDFVLLQPSRGRFNRLDYYSIGSKLKVVSEITIGQHSAL